MTVNVRPIEDYIDLLPFIVPYLLYCVLKPQIWRMKLF